MMQNQQFISLIARNSSAYLISVISTDPRGGAVFDFSELRQ